MSDLELRYYELAELQKQMEREQLERLKMQYESQLNEEIAKAIIELNLPANEHTKAIICRTMFEAMSAGYDTVSVLDAAKYVKENLYDDLKGLIGLDKSARQCKCPVFETECQCGAYDAE